MRAVTRRRLLRNAMGVAALVPWGARAPSANAAGTQLRKYLEPVPLPGSGIVVATGSAIAFRQVQIARKLHPDLPPTPFWAYDPSADGSGLNGQAGSFGMAVIAQSGFPVQVSFTHACQKPTLNGFRLTQT